MPEKLLRELGEADANMYMCSKDVRTREKLFIFIEIFARTWYNINNYLKSYMSKTTRLSLLFSLLLFRFCWRRNADFCLLRITYSNSNFASCRRV